MQNVKYGVVYKKVRAKRNFQIAPAAERDKFYALFRSEFLVLSFSDNDGNILKYMQQTLK